MTLVRLWQLSQLTLIASTLTLLAACGFKLRGNIELPPNLHTLAVVSADPYSDLSLDIKQSLKSAGATVLDTATPGYPTLYLNRERFSEDVLSISGKTAEAQEAMLRLHVSYRLEIDPNQPPIVDTVTVSQDYSFNPSDALAKTNEREVVLSDMRRHALRQILRRLTALTKAPESTENDANPS